MGWIEDRAQQIIGKLPAQGDFSRIFPWEQFYDQSLAKAGAMQRAEGYYLPILERNIDQLRSTMADRGLFRSGMRGQGEFDVMADVADSQQQMVDQLTAQREREMQNRYALLQSQFEENPTGFTAPTDLRTNVQPKTPTDYYGYRQSMYGTKPTTGYKYGLGTEEGSPYKYGQSYKQWWENKYKKTY